jgi:hypothetical protein
MHEASISEEVERWLRERAQEARRQEAERDAPAPTDPAQEQDRPYWPYLETDDFWRE